MLFEICYCVQLAFLSFITGRIVLTIDKALRARKMQFPNREGAGFGASGWVGAWVGGWVGVDAGDADDDLLRPGG